MRLMLQCVVYILGQWMIWIWIDDGTLIKEVRIKLHLCHTHMRIRNRWFGKTNFANISIHLYFYRLCDTKFQMRLVERKSSWRNDTEQFRFALKIFDSLCSNNVIFNRNWEMNLHKIHITLKYTARVCCTSSYWFILVHASNIY